MNQATSVAAAASKSLARRRHLPDQAKVRSTTHRRGRSWKPLTPGGRWIQRPPGVKGFQLLPRRWVVERTLAWSGRCRRLAKDFEAAAATEVAWFIVAHIRLLTRRLAVPGMSAAL